MVVEGLLGASMGLSEACGTGAELVGEGWGLGVGGGSDGAVGGG